MDPLHRHRQALSPHGTTTTRTHMKPTYKLMLDEVKLAAAAAEAEALANGWAVDRKSVV